MSKVSLASCTLKTRSPFTASCFPLWSGYWQVHDVLFQYVPRLPRCRGHTNIPSKLFSLRRKWPARIKISWYSEIFSFERWQRLRWLEISAVHSRIGVIVVIPLKFPHPLLYLLSMKHTGIFSFLLSPTQVSTLSLSVTMFCQYLTSYVKSWTRNSKWIRNEIQKKRPRTPLSRQTRFRFPAKRQF